MPEPTEPQKTPVERTIYTRLRAYGESSLPPSILATLIFPLHAQPVQALPMLFPPLLLFTSYVNLAGYKRDAAGASAAWSGLYLLLAARRKGPAQIAKKFGARGVIKGLAMGLAGLNAIAGGVTYVWGEKGRAEHWIGKE